MSESNMAEVCCYQQRQQQQRLEDLPKMKTVKSKMGAIKLKSRKIDKYRSAASLDQNNNGSPVGFESARPLEGEVDHADLLFKYRVNSSGRSIEELRELLREERRLQMLSGEVSAREVAFYACDYERMMMDDWLVTRFLLRGTKAFEREASDEEKELVARSGCDQGAGGGGVGMWERRSAHARHAILEHTLDLIKVCAKFRFDYQINGHTKLSEFPPDWTRVEGLIHHKPDLVGNPTAYLRVALHRPKLIEAPEARHQFKRYMLYLLECCDRELYNAPGKAICCVFDMTNAGFENIDLELTTWMIKSFKSCSPKLLCYVVVYNPPWFFTATFKVICNTLLSTSKRQSVKFAYGNEILNYVCYDNLPSYLSPLNLIIGYHSIALSKVSMMDPLMEENFFIENPENFENNFHCASKNYAANFKERSKEIVETMSKKNRHEKKVKKKQNNRLPYKPKPKTQS